MRGRHAVAEEQRCHLRQLVRFVEDHRVAGRQQFGHALVAQHHVGKEQVVIDHDQIGGHRLLARLHDEAVLVVRAVLPQAVVARRGDVLPHRRVLVDLDALGLVAALRGLGEDRDAAGVGGILAGQETAVGQCPLQVVGTDIVGAALEQRNPDRRFQDIAHQRQILVEQLVLQRLGTSRHDHLAVRLQRRHQVGEGLAGACASLGDENRVVPDRLGDALGHFELLAAHAITVDGAGKRAIGREDFRKGRQDAVFGGR